MDLVTGRHADGGVLAAGPALGVGEGAELAGAVVPDRVDPDDLAVLGQLDRPGDDGDVDEGAGPHPAGPAGGAGEDDGAVAVGQPGHGQALGGVPGLTAARARGARSAWSGRSRWAWVATTTPACRIS